MATTPLVVCDNLVKIYRVGEHDVVALQGLDLVVAAGGMLGIVGVSGSGKSSVLNVLGGLDRPTAGRVRVAGHDLLKLTGPALDRYRLHNVGFIWQQVARNLVPFLNARQNVELPLILAGVVRRARRQRAEALLEAVGMAHRKDRHLSELSGGEQQRVAIAVALANNPPLLLADEPTGEMDEETALQIYTLLRQLNRQYGLTILIVSHDQDLSRHVDRVVNIRDGKIVTETVQRQATSRAKEESLPAKEELTVLDAAGRLQIPRAYLETLGIRRRVHLEMTTEGVLIRPAAEADGEDEAQALVDEMAARPQPRPWTRLLTRWFGGNRREQ